MKAHVRRTRWMLGPLLVAIGLSACQPGAPTGPPSENEIKQLEERLQSYFKKAVNMPAEVGMKLVDVQNSAAPGLLTAKLELQKGTQTQQVPLALSRDGRFMIQGEIIDLSVDPDKAAMAKIALTDLPVRGNPSAAVTIVEYSDFQCPFCGRAYQTLEDQVLKDYGDKVRLIFKNFPLTNIHPWAESAALASVCARRQKPAAFWKLYDFLFQNQQSISADNLKEKAHEGLKDTGIDLAAFDACFDNKQAMDVVAAEIAEATSLGVRSTPTFFINGRKLEGAVPYETIKPVIDAQLQG